MAHATQANVKRLCNIEISNTDADDKIDDQIVNSDAYVDTQIEMHATVPVVGDAELPGLSDFLAAATYNYWQTPAKDRVLSGVEHWEKRIQDHIMAKYGKRNPTGLSGSTFSKTTSAVTGTEV